MTKGFVFAKKKKHVKKAQKPKLGKLFKIEFIYCFTEIIENYWNSDTFLNLAFCRTNEI